MQRKRTENNSQINHKVSHKEIKFLLQTSFPMEMDEWFHIWNSPFSPSSDISSTSYFKNSSFLSKYGNAILTRGTLLILKGDQIQIRLRGFLSCTALNTTCLLPIVLPPANGQGTIYFSNDCGPSQSTPCTYPLCTSVLHYNTWEDERSSSLLQLIT